MIQPALLKTLIKLEMYTFNAPNNASAYDYADTQTDTFLSYSHLQVPPKVMWLFHKEEYINSARCLKQPPENFCQTGFWQTRLVLLVDLEVLNHLIYII